MKNYTKCFTIALLFVAQAGLAQNVYVRKGLLDLRNHNFAEAGSVSLNGEWEFYMSQLIPPEEFTNTSALPSEYIDFPSTWNHLSKSRTPGFGFATYHLTLIVSHTQPLSIELPHLYSNYKLWINNQAIAQNGIVGQSAETSKPQWLPTTVDISPDQDSLDIVLQVSNFSHANGGIREPIIIGNRESLNVKKTIAFNSNLAMAVSLAIITIFFVLVFLIVKRDLSILFFAGLSLVWSFRSGFSNQYLATAYFPDIPWEIVVKIEYITLYSMMIFAILFVGRLFMTEVNTAFKYIFCFCNCMFIALTIFLRASVFTQFLPVYLSFAGILLLYITFVLIRAVVHERQNVWLMVTCVFLDVIIFSYDIIAFEGFAAFNPIIINVGYLITFLLMATCLLIHTGLIKRGMGQANVLTYEDLYGSGKGKR